MKILVFGASGQVGSALAERVKSRTEDWRFVARNAPGGDFLNLTSVMALLEREQAEVIVNAAAMTTVDKAQISPDVAMIINAGVPEALAQYAARNHIYLIHLSTDYVFDGSGTCARTESDAICPINVYGASKAAAEEAIFRSKCSACILRLTWVYGVHHSNFVTETVKKLLSGKSVTAFEDQIGSPTLATDVAEVIVKLVDRHKCAATVTGLYHFANTGYCSRLQCAQFILNHLGHRALGDVLPIKTAAIQLPAKRPLNCRLQTSKIQKALDFVPRSWQQAIAECVDSFV